MIAAGVGCRGGCTRQDIAAALELALTRAGRTLPEVSALYAPDFKSGERGLAELAAALAIPLVLLPNAALQAQSAAVLTRSARVERSFGVPSIAETAALAGAARSGGAARLLGPRVVFGAATCALADLAAREGGST